MPLSPYPRPANEPAPQAIPTERQLYGIGIPTEAEGR